MELVLDVYKRPYDPRHPVVCMDESPKEKPDMIGRVFWKIFSMSMKMPKRSSWLSHPPTTPFYRISP